MSAIAPPEFIQFCHDRRQAFNPPLLGSDIDSNSFHSSYELRIPCSASDPYSRAPTLDDCPLSYSMHIYIHLGPDLQDSQAQPTLHLSGLNAKVQLQNLQTTIVHSPESFEYTGLSRSPESLDLNIIARPLDQAVNRGLRSTDFRRPPFCVLADRATPLIIPWLSDYILSRPRYRI